MHSLFIKPVRRIFPKHKTFSKGIGELYQADLCETLQNTMMATDIVYLTCSPIKTKGADDLVVAFENLFRHHNIKHHWSRCC
jgi:hypothetical protein